MSKPHRIYTGHGQRLFADMLADNLTPPVWVQELQALPAPDTQRPTKQQLRRERATLQVTLDKAQRLLPGLTPYARCADQVAELQEVIRQAQARRAEITELLGEQQEGGPING